MKATDQIKHAAFEKTLDYLLEDPERIWTNAADPLFDKRHDPGQGMAETDKNKFDRLNRQRKPLEDKAQTGEPAA